MSRSASTTDRFHTVESIEQNSIPEQTNSVLADMSTPEEPEAKLEQTGVPSTKTTNNHLTLTISPSDTPGSTSSVSSSLNSSLEVDKSEGGELTPESTQTSSSGSPSSPKNTLTAVREKYEMFSIFTSA